MEAQVVQDEQVGGQERPEGAVHGVVHPGLGHGLGEIVGMDEPHVVTGADGSVAQGLGEEALTDTGGPQEKHVPAFVGSRSGGWKHPLLVSGWVAGKPG